jgi:protein TonB
MNKLLVFFFLCSAVAFHSKAQTPTEPKPQPDSNYVFTFVEEMPQFQGGEAALNKFIKDNLKYPDVPKSERKAGRVAVQFVIGKDGKVEDVRIMKPLSLPYDQEVIKMMYAMPNWIPGKQNGKTVKVRYLLPVDFR